jgi:hypothetical protein
MQATVNEAGQSAPIDIGHHQLSAKQGDRHHALRSRSELFFGAHGMPEGGQRFGQVILGVLGMTPA